MSLIVDKTMSLAEWQDDIDTNVMLRNGDWIDIVAEGSIWAGVWFTGPNGPRGWVGWSAGTDKPLPGSPPFCLLGRTAEDGYFFIGDGIRRTYQNATLGPGEARLFLRINDDFPGNGSGAFTVRVMIWRNPEVTVSLTSAGGEEQTLFQGAGAGAQRAAAGWARDATSR